MSRAPWVLHFGSTRTPFSRSIAAGDLFPGAAHGEDVARIGFYIAEGLLGVIVGDVGCGQTVAVRAAVSELDRIGHKVIYISKPAFGARCLHVAIVTALGGVPLYGKPELIARTSDMLVAEEAERHRRVIMVIDEAHLLAPDQLDELRLLSNAEFGPRSPFAGILVGTADTLAPLTSRRVRGPGSAHCRALLADAHRSGGVRQLPPPSPVLVGRTDSLFADDAVARLHRVANRLPRQLNNPATTALMAAAGEGKSLVDDASAKRAVAELTRE